MSLVMDSKNCRGRPQLHGVSRNGKVVYVTGPRVGMWVWDSAKHPILQKIETDVYAVRFAPNSSAPFCNGSMAPKSRRSK